MKKWHPGLVILPGNATLQEQKEFLFDYWQPHKTFLKNTVMVSRGNVPKWIQDLRRDDSNDNEIS